MIVVDSSAIIAILFEEPLAAECTAALFAARSRLISGANYVETGTVLAHRITTGNPQDAIDDLDDFLATFRIEIAPIEAEHARVAIQARVRYGKGFGKRKGLNFGDCFAYALAKRESAPLLYVGNDFTITDIESVLPTNP